METSVSVNASPYPHTPYGHY